MSSGRVDQRSGIKEWLSVKQDSTRVFVRVGSLKSKEHIRLKITQRGARIFVLPGTKVVPIIRPSGGV